ncbi:YktB family protein [Paenibacillus lentus]|uniref:UPF0637 protein EIM92_12950 n=1 Tax=Paenibacillus lentus TaxID=1338368 RepID=A0A3S8RVV8_9BACL|nr:DUF1054 domain-containing protein [Paenibacillus lentus]AZK46950.1 DUF1054 domain-containing protein [Paenibacillus lentus]
MTFAGFTGQDFDSLTIPGLEPRMEAIIANIRPKLAALGGIIAPYLSALCGEEMFPHVAKHARRTINPPEDTWIAWSSSKRGYKALPHFQVGMFSTHLFVIFAVIYESPNKVAVAKFFEKNTDQVQKLVPSDFYWSTDHMKPEGTLHRDMDKDALLQIADKLKTVKKSELLCGLRLDRDHPLLQDGAGLTRKIEQTFETLLPLYKGSF